MNDETEAAEPREVTPEIIMKQIAPKIDEALAKAARVAAAIVDDETRDIAITMAEEVQDQVINVLTHKPDPDTGDKGGWREQFYIPARNLADSLMDFCDPKIKKAKVIKDTLLGGVSNYNNNKARKERIEREAREAEARRIAAEAERKRKEAEEAEARAKAAAEEEERRKKEAELAEQRRIQAEKEAQEKRDREAREAAARELERKQKEEEEHRLAHAQEAQNQGAPQKVDAILSNATPISPVLADPKKIQDEETLRLQQEQAQNLANEKAELEAREAAEAKRKREEAETAAAKAKADAAAAALESAAAQAAASSAIVTRPDPRTTSVTRWKWDLASDGTEEGDVAAFLLLAKNVVEGRAPVEYLGFDPKNPTKFRPQAINSDVTTRKEKFVCPGIKAYPEASEQLKARRKVGGR